MEGYAAGLYLLTYGAAASFYELSNRATIAAAEQHSLDLIDVSAELGQRCPILSRCSSFFFGDLHPTAMGYEVIAESIMERLADDWGLPR